MSAEIEQVSAEEAIAMHGSGTALIDVREPWEFDRGHAPGATLLPTSQFEDRFVELSRDDTLLIICHAGPRSFDATVALVAAGYHAIDVAGGMVAWREAGGPVERDGEPLHNA